MLRWTIPAFFALLSWQQVPVWSSDLTLWTQAVLVRPGRMRPWINRTAADQAAGHCDAGIRDWAQAARLGSTDRDRAIGCSLVEDQRVWFAVFCPQSPLPSHSCL